jgi:N-acetylmuramoyl-L-alanine amidase
VIKRTSLPATREAGERQWTFGRFIPRVGWLSLLPIMVVLFGAAGGAFLILPFFGPDSSPADPAPLVTPGGTSAALLDPRTGLATPISLHSPIPWHTPSAQTREAQPPLPLAGRRIGLDPGHGPRNDLGAVLVDPKTDKLILSEAEFNLDVALRCRDLLRARGAGVVLTRESADTFTAPWPADANGDGIVGGSRDDLQERVDILNDFHAEVFLSIHANGGRKRAGREDVQVLYCSTSDCAFPVESKRFGKLVLDQLRAQLAAVGYQVQTNRLMSDLEPTYPGEPPVHMFVLGPAHPPLHPRATAMPGVISESLYVTSPDDAAQLNRDAVRQAIALAYADALEAHLTGSSK